VDFLWLEFPDGAEMLSRVRFWILDFGFWIGVGAWILHPVRQTMGILDFGLGILDFGLGIGDSEFTI
jgi:hypothetical protein